MNSTCMSHMLALLSSGLSIMFLFCMKKQGVINDMRGKLKAVKTQPELQRPPVPVEFDLQLLSDRLLSSCPEVHQPRAW